MNLMELVKGQLTDTVLQKLGGAVGLGTGEVSRAMDAIVPVQFDAIIRQSQTPVGAQNLLGMLGNFANLGSLGDLLGKADGLSGLLKMGESLLPMLFGGKLGEVVRGVSQATGMGNTGALEGLMKIAGPVVMGTLASQTKGMNPAGLMRLLGGLRGPVEAALPKGLAGVLGNLGGMAGAVSQGAGTLAGQVGGVAAQVPRRAGFPIWIPLVLLLLLLGFLLAFCNRATPASAPGTITPTPATPTGEFRITEPAEGASLPAGAFTLRGTGKAGDELEVSENGTSLGRVTVGQDGTWSLNVPSGTAGARVYEVRSPESTLTLNVTAAEATGSATECTQDFSLSITDGQTVREPFHFGGVGRGEGYTVTVRRGDRVVGTREIRLDSTCGWSYTSEPGAGPITYEVREIGADPTSPPLNTVNLTVQ